MTLSSAVRACHGESAGCQPAPRCAAGRHESCTRALDRAAAPRLRRKHSAPSPDGRLRERSTQVGARRADLTLFWRGAQALQRSRHDVGRARRISRGGLWRKQCACAGALFRRLSTRSAVAAPGCRWLALRTVGRRDYVPIRRTPDDQRHRGSPRGQRKRLPSSGAWLELR